MVPQEEGNTLRKSRNTKHMHTQNHLLLRFMYMQIQERIHKSSFRITRNTDVAEFSTFQPKNDDLYKWHAQLSPAW